ncbi:hypothetical protein DITRI_Ditri08aG0155000 [Diplodiscus trichospermus]
MPTKLYSSVFPSIIFLSLVFLFLYSAFLPLYTNNHYSSPPTKRFLPSPSSSCHIFNGSWVLGPSEPKPFYDETCPFHRNAWNCLKNKRENMGTINSWKWVPKDCNLKRIDPWKFLGLMRNRNIGFVGDSLNENFLVSFLCILRVADVGAKKWKKKGAWRGAYFPKYNVTVAYHRAVLLARYQWMPKQSAASDQDGLKGIYQVDVDIPADEWISIADFYDVLVFNTGHWWGYDKFPKETPLVFYRHGKPISPPLGLSDGLQVVLENMVHYIQKEIPKNSLKFWRLQSPRHFYGGEWNQNGSCLFDRPLEEDQVSVDSFYLLFNCNVMFGLV